MAADETRCPLTEGSITPLGDFTLPVIPGKPFAELNEAGLPPELSPGMGDEMPYPSSHLICNPDAATVTADTVGLVQANQDGLNVIPLWTVSEDGMTMTMNFYPTDCFGDPISDDKYRNWLPEGCRGVDNDALDAAVAEAKKTGNPVMEVVIARGVEPLNGRDGQVKLSFQSGDDVGTRQKDGSINFRERGGMACVAEGEHVASLTPPTPGKSGFDVLGNELPAKDGKPLALKAGTGVTSAGGDGVTQVFTATMAGMIVHKDDTLSISDILEINSDVDLASGNVHVDKGSILIKGTVTTGAEVTAQDNLVVEVVVENATLRAGNDVTVGGGVLMDEGGLIEAGGTVSAKFFRNATIRAGGDVVAEVDFVNCDIIATGRVISGSDKGLANGGVYVCGGMDVAEVGTDVGSTTEVTLALPGGEDQDIDDRTHKIQKRVEELKKFIGADDAAAALLSAPKEDRAILAELFKAKALLLAKIREIEEEKKQRLIARGKELARIGITARKTAHAGTTVRIGNKTLKLKKAVQASKIHWDPEKGDIAVSGI
jgi:hypothetical protein